MARIKGTDLVGLKKLMQKKGNLVEEKFAIELGPADLETYRMIMATSWTPVEVQARIYRAAAKVLYPGRQDGVKVLHRELAEQTYSGIYKVFLQIPSLKFIISRVASLWSTYYDKGKAEVKNITDSSLDFLVHDFPELPVELRDATAGHIACILEKIGNRNVRVEHVATVSDCWRWHATWS